MSLPLDGANTARGASDGYPLVRDLQPDAFERAASQLTKPQGVEPVTARPATTPAPTTPAPTAPAKTTPAKTPAPTVTVSGQQVSVDGAPGPNGSRNDGTGRREALVLTVPLEGGSQVKGTVYGVQNSGRTVRPNGTTAPFENRITGATVEFQAAPLRLGKQVTLTPSVFADRFERTNLGANGAPTGRSEGTTLGARVTAGYKPDRDTAVTGSVAVQRGFGDSVTSAGVVTPGANNETRLTGSLSASRVVARDLLGKGDSLSVNGGVTAWRGSTPALPAGYLGLSVGGGVTYTNRDFNASVRLEHNETGSPSTNLAGSPNAAGDRVTLGVGLTF